MITVFNNKYKGLTMLYHPLPLATFANGVQICPETLSELKKIRGRVYPVCLMGSMLSGKSTLLNQIIGEDIFKVGTTTNPLTKGLWVFPRHRPDLNCTLLFIDSQGFDNAYANENEEASIMIMLILVCRMIFHNSFGAVDSKIISRLATVGQKIPQFLWNSPELALVQRDFSLQLVDGEGNNVDAQDYLEYSFRNLKNKRAINQLKTTFANKPHSKIQCYLMPSPGQVCKYNKIIDKIVRKIQSSISENKLADYPEYNISHFVYRLQTARDVLLSTHDKGQKLLAFQQIVQKCIEDDAKIQLSAYKSHLAQTLKQISATETMPLPPQLLSYRVQKINADYFQGQNKFILQLISEPKLKEHEERILHKLLQENNKLIINFVKNKTGEYFGKYQGAKINVFKEEMLEGYSFLDRQNHEVLLQRQFWANSYKKLENKLQQYEKNQHKQLQQKAQSAEAINKSNQQLKIKLQQTTQKLIKSEQNLTYMNNQYNHLKKQLQSSQEKDKEVRQRVTKFYQLVQANKDRQVGMCEAIQHHLKESVTYQSSKKNDKTLPSNNNQIMKCLEDINHTLTKKQLEQHETLRTQQDRIISLEAMNRALRGRIEDMRDNGSESTIQLQYRELADQYSRFEKETYNRLSVKDQIIVDLNRKLDRLSVNKTELTQELEIMRNSLKDRNKGTEFLQQLISNKDNTIESLRNDLMENMAKYKNQISALECDQRAKEAEITDTLSMFIVKNQQLSSKVTELQTKLQSVESRYKREILEQVQKKDRQIDKLQKYIKEVESSIENATDSYSQVTEKMEMIITEKQNCLREYSVKMSELKMENQRISFKLEDCKQKIIQLKESLYRCQSERDQIEHRSKREEALLQNKIKHISNQNQKLKVQLKEKCSTFEMMLLQLRGQNILAEANCKNDHCQSDSTSINIRRLNRLEDEVLRELDLMNEQSGKKKCKVIEEERSGQKKTYEEDTQNVDSGAYKYSTGKKMFDRNSSAHKYLKSSLTQAKNLGVAKALNFNLSTNDNFFRSLSKY